MTDIADLCSSVLFSFCVDFDEFSADCWRLVDIFVKIFETPAQVKIKACLTLTSLYT